MGTSFKKRSLVVLLTISVFLFVSAAAAFADFGPPPSGVTITPGGENCNGIVPTPGSENTVKTLTGLTVDASGTHATYTIAYPVDAADIGDNWQITDCVLSGSAGQALKDYTVLDEAQFDGVINSTSFNLTFTYTIPASTPVGTRICNVAKTTEGPSAPQASNRKAGPACFIVGGDARVEKHSTLDPNGTPISGATFNIHDCHNTADDPTLQPIIINPVPNGNIYSAAGATVSAATIAFSGPSGSTCQVTETVAPPGYTLPPLGDRTITVTIPVGSEGATVYKFLDAPAPGSVHIHKDAPSNQQNTEFDFDIVCTNPSATYSTSITGTGDSTVHNIPAGSSCHVVETNTPSNDNVVITPSGNFTVGSNQTVNVTVTNSLKNGSLQVTKVAPAGSTDTYSFGVSCTNPTASYNFTITGSGSHTISGIPDGSQCTVTETDPGATYNPPVYNPANGTVTVSGDSTVTVTVTNTLAAGSVTITKVAPAEQSQQEFDFTLTCENDPNSPYSLSVTGSDSVTQGGIPANSSCTVEEVNVPDVNATPVVDPAGAFNVGPDQTVTVTVTNTLKPLSILIVKDVTPTSGAPGDSVTYTYKVTNTGDVMLYDVKVTDDKLGDIGTIDQLDPGESTTLTKKTTLPNAAGALTNVGTATGHDILGRTTSDDDDAVVTVVLAVPPLQRTGSTGLGTTAFIGIILTLVGAVMATRKERGRVRPAFAASMSAAGRAVILAANRRSWRMRRRLAASTRARFRWHRRREGPPRDGP